MHGSFVPVIEHKGARHWPIAVWSFGKIEIRFQLLADRPAFEADAARQELQRRLNEIPGVQLPDNAIDRLPTIPLKSLAKEPAMTKLLDVLNWVAEEIGKS